MIVVLIHWRIKPTDEAVGQFFDYWTKMATIRDKSGLAGEFLSAPVPANKLPFRVDDLSLGPGVLDCRHFINVGLWKDWESFYQEVGKMMNDDRRSKPPTSPAGPAFAYTIEDGRDPHALMFALLCW